MAYNPTSTRLLHQIGGKPQLSLVGTRCGFNAYQQFSGAGTVTRMQHCLPYGAKNLAFLYPGFFMTLNNPVKEQPQPSGNGWAAAAVTSFTGGTGYNAGDTSFVTVPTNSFAPIVQIDAVSGGVPTSVTLIDQGGYAALPAANSATTVNITGSGTGLTVNLSVYPCSFVAQVGIEQVWNTQSALSYTNLSGVLKVTTINTDSIGWLGSDNLIIPLGRNVMTDPVSLDLAPGSLIGSRIYSPSTLYYGGRFLIGSSGLGENAKGSASLATYNPYGATFPGNSSPGQGFQPLAILGEVANPGPTFVFVGDSIGYGVVSSGGSTLHDALDSNGNGGYLERAVNQTYPWANFCTSIDRMQNWLTQGGAQMRLNALSIIRPSHIIDEMGINDAVSGGQTYSNFKAMKIAFWQQLYGITGCKEIWATTLTPNTTSTDGWATTTNQTVTAANTTIQAYNADLRAGTFNAYITNVIDLGTSVESTVGSGIWPANGTGDGLHPSQSQTPTIVATVAPQLAGAVL